MAYSSTVELAMDLIRRPSITPKDAECQQLIAERLAPYGFVAEHMRFEEVDNLWLRRGTQSPLFVFAGHTDVVPVGELLQWHSDPFEPTIKGDVLYGRGVADMKGSIAAMLTAVEDFVSEHPNHQGSIALLITSDEEGSAINGTQKVLDVLRQRQEAMQWCLVGEPSSSEQVGDVIKNGRRGSLHGHLTVHGIQGHIAYPQLARNPIHDAAIAVTALTSEQWDQGNDFFDPTSLQIWQIGQGKGISNVIPADCQVNFNFRYSTEVTAEQLQQRVCDILDQHGLHYSIDWHLSGRPFLTKPAALVEAAQQAVYSVTGLTTELSTSGGTSDGRFIAADCAQVIELGSVNATIHQVNECLKVAELDTLKQIYKDILCNLLLYKGRLL